MLVDKVALGPILFRTLLFYPVSIIPLVIHVLPIDNGLK